MFNRSLFSSTRLDYATPKALYQALDAEFRFAVDVCAEAKNTKNLHFYLGGSGLLMDWESPAYMNPPYGRQIGKWIEKAYKESLRGKIVVALLPSRTDTRWWHDYVMMANDIRFIRGRLHFDERGPAPFPSAIIIWNKDGLR